MTEPRQIGLARNHDELVDLLVARKNELQLSDQLIDELGLFAPGYSNRILGPTREKTLSQRAFDEFCRLFAVSVVLVVDEEKVERIKARWDLRMSRCAHPSRRVSKLAISKVFSQMGTKSAQKRDACPTVGQASKFGRKGGRARAKNLSRKRRKEIATKGATARWRKSKQQPHANRFASHRAIVSSPSRD